ncbi:MAG: molybdopterin-dependent oxidoreductase [Dehalococcoidia bacterium]
MRRARTKQAVAGLVAAAVALAAGELLAALFGVPSLVVAVAGVIVDVMPGPIVRLSIDALGSSDKPALLITIVVATLAVGALLGPLAARVPRAGLVAFTVFGLVGFLAEVRDPLTSGLVAAVIAAGAVATGYAALRFLLHEGAQAEETSDDSDGTAGVVMPGRGVAGRRRFLAFAATTAGAAAVTAVAARRFSPTVDVEGQRRNVVLPPVEEGVAVGEVGLPVEGISPLITPNAEFYRIDTAFVVPRVDTESWRLRVTGMIDQPYEMMFDELLAMPAVEESITLACVSNEVGGDLVGNAIWRGVPLPDLLERAGVQDGATQIVGRSVDGFTAGFPTEAALDGRKAIVAYAMNGEPLPAEHGFPARLVVPGLYGYVSATKWLYEIRLTTLEEFDAYWIPRGWAKEAPVKTQSRIDVPRDGGTVRAGRSPVAGVAWGGIRGIRGVEVRITGDGDAEPVWHQARLSDALSRSSWRQWVVDDWEPAPGDYRVEVRATDGEGTPQTEERSVPPPDGATGLHGVTVTVSDA